MFWMGQLNVKLFNAVLHYQAFTGFASMSPAASAPDGGEMSTENDNVRMIFGICLSCSTSLINKKYPMSPSPNPISYSACSISLLYLTFVNMLNPPPAFSPYSLHLPAWIHEQYASTFT